MKKRNRIFFILGTILSLVPIYHFFGWIYVWNKYYETEGRDVVCKKFDEDIFFNLFVTDWRFGLSLLIIGVIAGVFLLLSMIESLNDPNLKVKKLNLIVFIINVLFTFWIAWGLM